MGEIQDRALRHSEWYGQSHYKGGWAYSKVLWMAKPEVHGTVVVRGQQIDGPIDGANWIGFGMGDVPEVVLQL